jgi:hypothetical protein
MTRCTAGFGQVFARDAVMATYLRQPAALVIASLSLLMLASEANAQTAHNRFATDTDAAVHATSPARLKLDLQPLVEELVAPAQPSPARRRDSLKNGTIIGAVIGAAAGGIFGAVLCNALQEPGDPSCVTGTLRVAAFGAAIGAGAGLAVDAAFSRQSGARVSVALRF